MAEGRLRELFGRHAETRWRLVPLILGGIAVVILVLWAVLFFASRLRLLQPGNLLSVLPADNDGYIHLLWADDKNATALQELDTFSALTTWGEATFGLSGEDEEAIQNALGNEVAWYAPSEKSNRLVFVAEIRNVDTALSFLRGRDPDAAIASDGTHWRGTVHDVSLARLLSWPSMEQETFGIVLDRGWVALSFVPDDLDVLIDVEHHREAPLLSSLPFAERLRGRMAHGLITERFHDIMPDLVTTDDKKIWWNATSIDGGIRIQLRNAPDDTVSFFESLAPNTIAVQMIPAGDDIMISGPVDTLTSAGSLPDLLALQTGTPITETLAGLTGETPVHIAVRSHEDGTHDIAAVMNAGSHIDDVLRSVETTVVRTLARQSPTVQEKTLYDGTVVGELYPDPSAVQRSSEADDVGGIRITWLLPETGTSLVAHEEGGRLVIATSVDMAAAYAHPDDASARQSCGSAESVTVTGPISRLLGLPNVITDRVSISVSTNGQRTRTDVCLFPQ